MQLSKLEHLAYRELKINGLSVFKAKDLRMVLSVSKAKAYNIIRALKRKNAIKKSGKNSFALAEANEFVVGQAINYPSYLSFWSALSYYGFSDQLPKKIFFATTKYSREINNFRYVTLSKERFFGYTRIGELCVAEKEKAIVDSLLLPKYAGGIRELVKCFRSAREQIDLKRLVDYAFKIKSKAVLRRLGFILENKGYKTRFLNQIRKKIGKGYELLDPSLKRRNNLNKRWLLDVNC